VSSEFARLYPKTARPSIPPEELLRGLLLQLLYSVRIERQLMEQLDYNLLFRWFAGLTDSALPRTWHRTLPTETAPSTTGRHARPATPSASSGHDPPPSGEAAPRSSLIRCIGGRSVRSSPLHESRQGLGGERAREEARLCLFDPHESGQRAREEHGRVPVRRAGRHPRARSLRGARRDETAVYRRGDTWYRWDLGTGIVTARAFGSPDGIPVSADYNHDGQLDVAFWEPAAREIRVSFSHGRTVDRVIVPPLARLREHVMRSVELGTR